ncbi:MAG: hypothetical protein SH857_12075 [Chitinophagales bacterium]|nr:hypothetical protein [Chitinophagales bacterium]
MKILLLLLLALSSSISSKNEHSLVSLVFDFSSDLKSTLPDDGWVKMNFSVVHYSNKPMKLNFKATCIESGLELPYYPQTDRFDLKSGVEQPITLFMNAQCGKLENLAAGKHSRVIRFQFIDAVQKDTLAFDQMYIIEVPK